MGSKSLKDNGGLAEDLGTISTIGLGSLPCRPHEFCPYSTHDCGGGKCETVLETWVAFIHSFSHLSTHSILLSSYCVPGNRVTALNRKDQGPLLIRLGLSLLCPQNPGQPFHSPGPPAKPPWRKGPGEGGTDLLW